MGLPLVNYVSRLDLKESKEGFCRRGRGRSFHVDGQKTEKAQELTVERAWYEESQRRLRVSETERRVRDGV